MGDIARRRELRKRKILENAELRKQKIFGLCSTPKESSSNLVNSLSDDATSKFADDLDERASIISHESEGSLKSCDNDSSVNFSEDLIKLGEVLRNIPDPLEEINENEHRSEVPHRFCDGEHMKTSSFGKSELSASMASNNSDSISQSPFTSLLHNSTGGSFLSNNSDTSLSNTTPTYFWCWLEHSAAPSFLGLVVLLLLFLDLGELVSNSYVIPFCIWEIQQIIASYTFPDFKEDQPGIIEMALLLCGINKTLISRYNWISKLLKDIVEDFAVYIITIIVMHQFAGFTIT